MTDTSTEAAVAGFQKWYNYAYNTPFNQQIAEMKKLREFIENNKNESSYENIHNSPSKE